MISIIIPTFNRKDCLFNLLKQLSQYHCEVIVIDDLSTDGTEKMIKRRFTNIVYKKSLGKGQGYARQLGVKIASGDIIGVFDDDIILGKNFLRPIEKDFKEGCKAVQTKLIFLNKGEENIKEDNKDTGKLKWNLFSKRKLNYGLHKKYIESCADCGIFFRKEILNDISFFNKTLIGDDYGKSILLSLKLNEHGVKILFEPNSVIYHIGVKSGGSVERYNKKRDNFCSEYTKIIVKNMMYLNSKFNKHKIFFVKFYFTAAGIYFSLRNKKNCLKYFLEGMKNEFISTNKKNS